MIHSGKTVLGLTAGLFLASATQAAIYDFDIEDPAPIPPAPPTLDGSLWTLTYPAGQFSRHVGTSSLSVNNVPINYTANSRFAAAFNMNAIGGPIAGDFDVSVDFTDTSIGGNRFGIVLTGAMGELSLTSAVDNIPTPTTVFQGSTQVGSGYSPDQIGVILNSGTLRITRTGNAVSYFVNDAFYWSFSNLGGDITGISLVLDNRTDGSYGTVTFSNFEITAVPEPASLAIAAMGGAGLLLRRRR